MERFFNRVFVVYKKKRFVKFGRDLIGRIFIVALTFPAASIITVVSPWKKIRLIKLCSSRIGQYGGNTHLMLCAIESKNLEDDYKNYLYAEHPIDDQKLQEKFGYLYPPSYKDEISDYRRIKTRICAKFLTYNLELLKD